MSHVLFLLLLIQPVEFFQPCLILVFFYFLFNSPLELLNNFPLHIILASATYPENLPNNFLSFALQNNQK